MAMIALLLAVAAGIRASSSFSFAPSSQFHVSKIPTILTNTGLRSTAEAPTKRVGVTTGDTKGANLLLTNLNIATGSGNIILKSINFRVDPKERWGIVGPNGCGKSTLLGAITGTVRIDGGDALVASKVKVGYLKQTAVSGSTRTVREEAASEMEEINNARRLLDKLEEKITNGDASEKTLNDLAEAQSRFEDVGGWTQEQDVDLVLKGLGFMPTDSDRLCSDFSGGWQMRIALARLLLSQPDLLMLDEPSNHLDSSARDWLATYLSNYQGSILLVSHDVALLSKAVNSIAEVSGQTLIQYVSCSYDKYLSEKDFRAKSAMAEYERNMKEAARLQEFVDKFGASATKAASAQSRVKMIEKMKREGKLDPPPLAVVEVRRKPSLVLPDPPKGIGEKLLVLKKASIGYGDGSPPILEGIDLVINRGVKLILRGPNGAGKSTLLAALRGKLPLIAGERIENERLRLGVFTQDLAQELDVTRRAMDLVTDYARGGIDGDITISNQDARGVMGRLGLSDEKPLRIVGELSGGEKARVALSMFALKASNLLLLDEPSNHLDIECIEALGESLSNWGGKDGSVVVVSHDRAFCESVGFTHVGTVKDGTVVIEERGLMDSDWARYDINGAALGGCDDIVPVVELTKEEKEEQERKRKLAFNAPKMMKKIEDKMSKAEAKIAEYETQMEEHGSDAQKLVELLNKKSMAQIEVNKLMEEYESLEAILADCAKDSCLT